MISKWKYVFWPLAMLNSWRGKTRNHLFDSGVWKSVEFEMPVINVGSLSDFETLGLSAYIQSILKGSSLRIDRYGVSRLGLQKEKTLDFNYCSPLNRTKSFIASHSVLGLSEWYQHFPETTAFIQDNQFQLNEIRPGLSILIMDYLRPWYEDHVFPVGSLLESKEGAKRADIVIVCQTPENADMLNMKSLMQELLRSNTPVFFIKNSAASLKTFNSSDQIEFISDRDNFERLILNVLPNANPDSE